MSELKPAGEQQLESDLVHAGAVAERLDEGLGLLDAWHVERHDEAVAGKRHAANFLAAMASASTTLLHRSCCALSLRLPSASKASIARGTAICCGITVAPMPTSRIWRRWSRLRIAP